MFDALADVFAPTQDGHAAVDIDTALDLLANARRRRTLRVLADADGPTRLRTLAEAVAAVECDTPVDRLTSEQTKRVYVGLYQTHVPKLAGADAVEYDGRSGSVALTPRGETLVDVLEAVEAQPGVSA